MFGSSMLDIAVGVVFIFLLLSVFATAINEVLFSFFNMRGKYLYKGIVTLLNDESGATTGLVQKIYNHGQVYGLYQGPFDPKKRRSLPSYIPARNFALAFLDSVAQPSSQAPAAHLPDPAAPAPGDAPTLVPEQAPPPFSRTPPASRPMPPRPKPPSIRSRPSRPNSATPPHASPPTQPPPRSEFLSSP